MKKKSTNKKKIHWLRLISRILFGFAVFIVLILLFIRSPWGQNIIIHKVTSYISNKTHTKVEVKKLFIDWAGNLNIQGVYLEDKKGDTLLYSKSIEANIPVYPILNGTGFDLNQLKWEGVRANVIRTDSIKGFNYQFLIDAFVDSTQTKKIDTTAKPFKIDLGKIDLKDAIVKYQDDASGLFTKDTIGHILLDMDGFDLEKMKFHVANAAIENSNLTYQQKIVPSQKKIQNKVEQVTDTIPLLLPQFIIDKFTIKTLKVAYNSEPDSIKLSGLIPVFSVDVPNVNLNDSIINVGNIKLKNATIAIDTKATTKAQNSTTTTAPFVWPSWKIAVDNIDFEDNAFWYSVNNEKVKPNVFNANAIDLQHVNLALTNFKFDDKAAQLQIKNLSGVEGSGFHLKNFQLKATMNQNQIDLHNLVLQLNQNQINGDATISYNNVNQLINHPGQVNFKADVPNLQLFLNDLFRFQPSLKQNEYIAGLSKKGIFGTISVEGNLSYLTVHPSNLRWGARTKIQAAGTLSNLTNPKLLAFNVPTLKVNSVRSDLIQFLNEDDFGLRFPDTTSVVIKAKGTTNNLSGHAKLLTTDGTIALDGNYKNEKQISFQTTVKATNVNLQKILKNPNLDTLSVTLNASGSGNSLNTLNAQLSSKIDKLSFKGYNLSALQLNGKINNGKGGIYLYFKDENLDMQMDNTIVLDSVAPEVNSDLNVKGIDLFALGITRQKVRAKFNWNTYFKGNGSKFTAKSVLNNTVVVYNNKPYYLSQTTINANVKPDSTAVSLKNSIVTANVNANADITTISKAVQTYLQHFIKRDTVYTNTIKNPVNAKVNVSIAQNTFLSDVLLPGLQRLDSVHFDLDFNQKKNELTSKLYMPNMQYNDVKLDSLAFDFKAKNADADFNFGIKSLQNGRLKVPTVYFGGHRANKKLALYFKAEDDSSRIVNLRSEITKEGENVIVHVLPDSLLINRKNWSIPQTNQISFSNQKITTQDVTFSNENQQITFSDQLAEKNQKDNVGIHFSGFKLSNLLSLLNPKEPVAKGILNGNFIVVNPYGKSGMLAKLDIQNLQVLKAPLGNLNLRGRALGDEKYEIIAALKDGDIDLDLKGKYVTGENASTLDLNLLLNKVQLAALEKFSDGAVTDTDGYVSGEFNISGTTAKPDYKGSLSFNQAQFNVKAFNNILKIDDEKITVNNEDISFDNFEIHDKDDNVFAVNGTILTKDALNPAFDLKVKADHFQLLNSTKEDNDLFYGTANVDADASIKGDLTIPEIHMKLTANKGTNFTYVIPESQAALEQRDGVVIFVNKKNPDDILTRNDEETTATLKGFRLDAILSFNKNAIFNVITNPKTNDNFEISGEGDLNFTMDENGRTSLTGRYKVNDGHYELSLYNIVKRRFDLVSGSTVVFSGDPMDADLNVKAVYKVETSASSLMSSQVSSSSAAVKSNYSQQLPFLVYLNVGGELMKPKLTFNLDMPEEERNAGGGAVYSRIKQLDQQEDELNKQVFSLLVLNRFFPGGSDGSSGGTAAIARDNLNQALSDQLNTFSNKLLGKSGVQLGFNLDSYTDYQGTSAQNRTQLDISAQKKLLNDRLILKVGSQVDVQGQAQPGEENPLIGDVSVEYLLTKDGRFRIKGFRRNTFENVIDGQLIVSGISLIFNREFNKFKELWHKTMPEEKMLKEAQKEKQEEENSSTEKEN
ncbi:translocation/assembly module TamB domain-containing protein [Zhouia sp. PK063]|uniref:translocation/assembly module TamB domain-containing protein n=1 Tax=Zhouia sp. PK063 TaxID=3373602 RepID=UPI0037B0F4F8